MRFVTHTQVIKFQSPHFEEIRFDRFLWWISRKKAYLLFDEFGPQETVLAQAELDACAHHAAVINVVTAPSMWSSRRVATRESLQEKSFNSKLSGNEGYYTA